MIFSFSYSTAKFGLLPSVSWRGETRRDDLAAGSVFSRERPDAEKDV